MSYVLCVFSCVAVLTYCYSDLICEDVSYTRGEEKEWRGKILFVDVVGRGVC